MPRLTLQRKVFLALTALLAALLMVFIGLSRLGLQRNLGDYVAEIELSRMDWFALRLEQAYATTGSWQFLEQNPQAWHRLQMSGERVPPANRPGPSADQASPPPDQPFQGEPPPPKTLREPRQRPEAGPRPPRDAQAQLDLLPRRHAPPAPPDAPNDPRGRADSVYQRMALLDPQARQYLAGNRIAVDTAIKRPLMDNNQIIAYLAIAPLDSVQTEAGRAFIAQQSTFVLVSGLVGLGLALLISWQLTRRWLAPIRELMAGAKSVAQGHLETRIPVHGQDELATLTLTFNNMAQRLFDTQANRERWLADVAHELRTPLAAMRAEIEAVQDGIRPFAQPTAVRLHRQVMRLSQLVDDLRLSMNDDEARSGQYVSGVRPLDVLLEAARLMHSRIAQAGLVMDVHQIEALAQNPEVTVVGDASRLHQVFVNLLENALLYTQPGGQLRITAQTGSPPVNTQLTLTFDDSEPAPSVHDLPRLFERLYRGESSRNRQHGGSGLGLAICKAIMEAHGGTIIASLSPLGGLRVSLVLPLETGNRPESNLP